MVERSAGDLSSKCHYSEVSRSVDIFMESGRHAENSLSTLTEEQKHGQGWDQGGKQTPSALLFRISCPEEATAFSACGLDSFDGVRGN